MIQWLDFKLFGNGRGLAQPEYDGQFYWLNGHFYYWIGGSGAQLGSFQWFATKIAEERNIAGRIFRVLNYRRIGPRVDIAWSMVNMSSNPRLAMEEIKFLKRLISEADIFTNYHSYWANYRQLHQNSQEYNP